MERSVDEIDPNGNLEKIDANGDTLLILRSPNATFPACDDTSEEWLNILPQYPSLEIHLPRSALSTKLEQMNVDGEPSKESVVRMQVSSKHLMFASKYFQRALSSTWAEGESDSGYDFVVSAQDWDQEALLIVMNVIHGRTRTIPQEVSLKLLAKIAVVVDYYECHDAVDFFSKVWIRNLGEGLPTSYGEDVSLRLSISYVFSEFGVFRELTKTIITMSRGPIYWLDLPGLAAISDALEEARYDVIGQLIDEMYEILYSFYDDDLCSFECSSILLVLSEPGGSGYVFPDNIAPHNVDFKEDMAVNVTCWTLSSMLDDEYGRYWENPNSSFIWVWVELEAESFSESWRDVSVGNLETGGIAGGHGCWMHEDNIKAGEDLYLPDEIRWCGDAPHHQVGAPGPPQDFDDVFVCRNCTDLDVPACQTTYPTVLPNYVGFTDVGCWKHGTEVNGNTTWVSLIDPSLENCFISPDQFVPEYWHGPPAGECED